MFAYNPTPDRSAEILARANENAAAIQMRSMENLGDSLAAMGESAAKAYSKASENQLTNTYLDGMAGELSKTMRPDGTPYMTAEDLLEVSKAPQGKKQALVTSRMAQLNYDQSLARQQAQYAGALDLALQKHALGLTGRSGSGSSTPDPTVNLLYRN